MSRRRLLLVAVLLGCSATVVMARSVQLMVLGHQRYQRLAQRQHERKLEVPSRRGDIRSADGYLLACSAERTAIQVDTRLLVYPELFCRAAASVLGADPEQMLARLETGPRAVWLAQRVSREQAEAVRDLAPGAIALVPDSERLYPLGSVAAAAVGFTGREELQTVGRSGFEHGYDQMLGGEPEQYLAIHDAVQRQLRLERLHVGRAGYDIVLTLNARLQTSCERELRKTISTYAATSGSAVVLDPHTGHVLALASVPSFDPKRPATVSPEGWRLRPVQDAWEPGSTIKPIVAIGALALEHISGSELFDCRRRGIDVAGVWIRDHADPGVYNLDQVIAQSANAGIVTVAQAMPPASLHQVLRAFGFGRRPGLDFPAETSGILPDPKKWSRLSRAGLALGQELTASPLQVAVAYAALANGGWLPRPRLVLSASGDAALVDGEPSWHARVLSEPMARRATDMLELVVLEGTGRLAHVPGYRIAGKTGTAQRAVPGGFDEEHHVAWFAGFLPLPHPRAVIVVAVEDPREDYWASSVAAPCFARIAEEAMRILRIPALTEANGSGPESRT